MSEFTKYRRTQIAEMRPFEVGERTGMVISISAEDIKAGSPKLGDMIARNPKNHADQWLVAAQYFADNFEPMDVLTLDDKARRALAIISYMDAQCGEDAMKMRSIATDVTLWDRPDSMWWHGRNYGPRVQR